MEYICKCCNKIFIPKRNKYSKFCSQSCAAKFNNKFRIRKYNNEYDWDKISEEYINENKTVRYLCNKYGCSTAAFCKAIKRKDVKKKNNYRILDITIGEIRNKYKNRPKKNTYQNIRHNAILIMKNSNKEKVCSLCGWDKHVEVHHIKNIGSFEDTVKISEINSLDNLIYVCPNCHWVLENEDMV